MRASCVGLATSFLLLLLQSPSVAAQSSCTKAGDKCGDNQSFSCCESGNFCQPWEPGYYQCIAVPSGCGAMETDVDYNGDDLESFTNLKLPSDCCDKCAANPQCTAFTFLNQAGPACYLKKGTGSKTTLKGAVSGRRIPPCSTAPQASCGNATATTCCPSDHYCQPWDANFYQCITPAPGCGTMETDVDFFGADVASVQVQFPWDCCQQCQARSDCQFFTFVNNAAGGPMCYLKSSDAGRQVSKGAVSGRKLTPTPTPTTPTPPPTTPKPTPVPTCVDIGLPCGGSVSCCDKAGAYCHPWAPTDYQCIEKPATCDANIETDIDYFGADLRSVSNVDLAECCDACARDAECKTFTFATTQRTCYMKTSDAGRVTSAGSLSGKKPQTVITPMPTLPTPAPTPRPPTTPTPTNPTSGNWDTTRCGTQKRNLFYHGNDIAGSEKALETVEACCDLCRATPACKLFTYFRRGDQKRCLLKTGPQNLEKTNYADRDTVFVASGVFV